MLPVQLDLTKLSHPIVFNAIAPIFPGGIIALGWLYGHEAFWGNLHDERALKIIAVGFAIYIIGTVITYLSEFDLGFVALLAMIAVADKTESSKNSEWRKLASKFLGPDLSPPLEEQPLRWRKWHDILSVYFPVTKNFQSMFGSFYFTTLNSIGWAGLVSAYISSKYVSWLIWTSCGVVIAISHVTYPIHFAKQYSESTDQLTAEILKAIKNP